MHNGNSTRWAFVASTLPALFLQEKASLDIVRVVTKSPDLKYIYDKVSNTLNIQAVKTASNTPYGVLKLGYYLLVAKVTGVTIVFFHECCWPIFDILLSIIKPVAEYHPQVLLTQFKEISFSEYLESESFLKFMVFKLLRYENRFRFFVADNDEGMTFKCLSYRSYNKRVTIYRPYRQSHQYQNTRLSHNINIRHRTILFLVGKDACSSEILISTFIRAINYCTDKGHRVLIKDHPSTSSRLNLEVSNVVNIDPDIPAELVYSDFDLVIGLATTALAYFGRRSISLINLLELPHNVRERRIANIKSLDKCESISFPNSWEELQKLIS